MNTESTCRHIARRVHTVHQGDMVDLYADFLGSTLDLLKINYDIFPGSENFELKKMKKK